MDVTFPCPLCRGRAGRDVRIVAELDLETRYVTVADLSGCAHAARFGEIDALSEDDERALIDAALNAWEQRALPPRAG
jgi:hypothetical protein